MSKNELRQSQLVGVFGPGAMVDLPTRSVIVGGLERWEMRDGAAWKPIEEPRLTTTLEVLLQQRGVLPHGSHLALRTPPGPPPGRVRLPPGVQATIFPTWFVSDEVSEFRLDDKLARGRRLIPWSRLDAKGGRRRHRDDANKAIPVTPIRFVGACEKGHIQDINWPGVVHGDAPNCGGDLWLEEQGTSGDPRDVTVACTCGRSVSLVQISAPKRLGGCAGRQPWLEDDASETCSNDLRLLIRTATNTYFSQVATVISMPQADDTLSRLVQNHLSDLREAESIVEIRTLRKVGHLKASFEGYSDEDVFAALQQVVQNASIDGAVPVKVAEFDRLASGDATIGQNAPDSLLFAETLPKARWRRSDTPAHDVIEAVVAVHRLREVSCLYGFTRFEAAPTMADGELEDIGLAVDGAPISRSADWLPAVEQFGEGVFLKFDTAFVGEWMKRNAVSQAGDAWLKAHDGAWRGKLADRPPAPGTGYVLLHSLAHALMLEIALYCGYPASSLKERVYAMSAPKGGAPARCGLLIYTASAGAQGSLGGLAAMSDRIIMLLDRVLDRMRVCSNDPVCADHRPGADRDARALLGAACHGCLLIAETSCEARNHYLDRGLLVSTMADDGAAFFT